MELTAFRRVSVPATINIESTAALSAAIEEGIADTESRGLVLEGGPLGFCRGMDIATLEGPKGQADPRFEASVRVFADVLYLLWQAPKPTVAVVVGPVLGGGLGIAAACDVVVAARTATFGLPEGLFGLIPAIIAPFLLQRITAARLRTMALVAEPIGAETARVIGLVDEVVDDEAVPRRVQQLTRALARVHPATKSLLAAATFGTRGQSAASSVQTGVEETSRAAQSREVNERIARFLDGGAPWQSS